MLSIRHLLDFLRTRDLTRLSNVQRLMQNLENGWLSIIQRENMPYTEINGISIHYEVHGPGPALLMMAPGGFDSTIEKWTASGL